MQLLRETVRRWKYGTRLGPIELDVEWDASDPALVRPTKHFLRCVGHSFEMEVSGHREGVRRARKSMWWCPGCAVLRGHDGTEDDP